MKEACAGIWMVDSHPRFSADPRRDVRMERTGIWMIDSHPRFSVRLWSKRKLAYINPHKVREAIRSVIVGWKRKKSAEEILIGSLKSASLHPFPAGSHWLYNAHLADMPADAGPKSFCGI
jgi:hypothetical protein